MARSALLLSGPLGLGHEMPARAFTGLLTCMGWRVRTRDSMSLLGDGGGRAGRQVFDRLIAVPGVYDGLHFYKRFYFRAPKIAEMSAEMLRHPSVTARRLREGAEFLQFLRRADRPA